MDFTIRVKHCLGNSSPKIKRLMMKISGRYRMVVFAIIMSASTACIVSGIIISLRMPLTSQFLTQWLTAFLTAWPIVFIAILVIAPLINKLLDLWVEKN